MGPSRARLEKFVPIQDLVIFARRTAEDHEAPRSETMLEPRDLTQLVMGFPFDPGEYPDGLRRVAAFLPAHEAQILTYLCVSHIDPHAGIGRFRTERHYMGRRAAGS
jgi:hypothetical protein